MAFWRDRMGREAFFRVSAILLICTPLFLPRNVRAAGRNSRSGATSASSWPGRRAQASGQKKSQKRQPAAARGEGMGAKTVGNLPLNGRSASQVAALGGSPSLSRRRASLGFGLAVLAGWQIGGVFEASSGLPFTPGFGGDPLGVLGTDPNVDVPNVLSGPGCGSLVNPGNPNHYIRTQCLAAPNPITLRGNLGRNAMIGPGLMNLDFSIFKNNTVKLISESVHLQFRAEIFNIFNRANFNPPIYFKNVFDSHGNPIPSGGFIDQTQDPSRQIQFALRISF